MLLFNLESEVQKKEIELRNIEDQIKEHTEAVNSLNQSLADSNCDLESLQQEHKKLMQAWGEVIVAVQHRDKMLSKIRHELLWVLLITLNSFIIFHFLSDEHEKHKTIQAGIETTKKFILKELETSEKLNEFKDRLLRDMNNIEKQGEFDSFMRDNLLIQHV